MKTIFISSFHLLVPRNILFTPILDGLLRSGDVRVILLVPDSKKDYFERTFRRSSIIVEGVPLGRATRTLGDRMFERIAHAMLDTTFLRIRYRAQLRDNWKFFPYYLLAVVARRFAYWNFARSFLRALDSRFSSGRRFNSLFERYQPDLVFSTQVMDKYDAELVHTARRLRVPVIGMVRSWDNLTKEGLMRAIPDQLLVWNEWIKKEAIAYHGVSPGQISIVGIPHYDWYSHGARTAREEFFRSIHADPQRPLIMFAPTGAPRLRYNDADRYILEILAAFDATILVRFPPTNPVDLEGFVPPPNVVFDKPGVVFGGVPHFIDAILEQADDRRLADEVFHSDVVVCGPTTIAIDAAVFSKPTILVNFHDHDGPFLNAVAESYQSEHLQYLLRTGGVRLVNSREEFLEWLHRYLANPWRDIRGRRRIVEEQCWRLDGKSSARVLGYLLARLHQPQLMTPHVLDLYSGDDRKRPLAVSSSARNVDEG